MKTLNLGIILDQGADFSLVIEVAGQSGPIDITNYVFKSQMRSSTDPNLTAVAEFSFSVLNQTTNLGQVQWTLPASVTTMLAASIATPQRECRQTTPYIFDVKMKDSAGNIRRIIQGLALVSPQATQEVFS